MQVIVNVPDNLPFDMVQSYLKTIEEQMKLVSELLSKTNNSTSELRALFKETQNLADVILLNDDDIEAEIKNYRNA